MGGTDQPMGPPSDAPFLFALTLMYVLSPITAMATTYFTAPYGRHVSTGWGPQLPSRLGWILMESPSLWLSLLVFSRGRSAVDPKAQTILAVYLFHYLHRVLVYPWRARLRGKRMPLLVAALAFLYNVQNAYLQAYQVGQYHQYPKDWLTSPFFLAGLCCFVVGFYTNVWADSILFGLRKSDEDKTYKVPQGGLYEYISCPNYFGECLEWLGWAILTQSSAGLAFFLCTCANLIPRARANHEWYKTKFEDYPRNKKAVIPFLL